MKSTKTSPYIHRMNNELPLFKCAMIADNHQLSPMMDKRLKKALESIANRDIHHVLFAGDITQHGTRFQLKAFFSLLKNYPYHYHIALGNHDTFHRFHEEALRIPPELELYAYQQQVYYKTVVKNMSIYVLNTQKPQEDNIYFQKDQLAWLAQELQQDTSLWKLILCHQPFADSHPFSEDRTMHIGFQNALLLDILKHHDDILFISGHLHNSYSLDALCLYHGIACLNVPGFDKIDHGINQAQIGVELSCYQDFLFIAFYDYGEDRMIDSVYYIYDRHLQQIWKEYSL